MNKIEDKGDKISFKSILQQFFFFFGPILASFHVATYIVGFFSVGAVARWITHQWFPFTRWFWSEVAQWSRQYVNLPELSIVEKDALTTVAFFAPLGIYALMRRDWHPLDSRYIIIAPIIGLLFLSVTGIQLIRTVFDVFQSIKFVIIPETDLQWVAFSIMFILMISMVYLFSFLNWHKNIQNILKLNEQELHRLELLNIDHTIYNVMKNGQFIFEKRRFNRKRINIFIFWCYVLMCVLWTSTITTALDKIAELGVITFSCFISVIVLAVVSIFRTPYRLSWGLGSLIAFVLSGIIFEGVIVAAEFIQSVNR